MVFQDYALFPHLTVAGNVGFGLVDAPEKVRSERVRATLQRVGSPIVLTHSPTSSQAASSSAWRWLGRWPRNPGLMLMDEPFANLDVTLRNAVRDDTLDLLKSVGASVLLVTHDPEEAMRMADRIAVMQNGRLVQCGTPEDVYLRPVNAFMASFFGPVNQFEADVRDGLAVTPFGLQNSSLRDGPVHGIVRPEAIQIAEQPGDSHVEDVRLIGAYWRVSVRMADGRSVRVRTIDRPPPPGTSVAVTIDPSRTILFPAGA